MSLTRLVATAFLALAVACAPTLSTSDSLNRARLLHELREGYFLEKKHNYCKKEENGRDIACRTQEARRIHAINTNTSVIGKLRSKIFSMGESEFKRYKSAAKWAKRLSNIRNFHRYSTHLLEESNANLTSPNYKADKPLMVVFMSPQDRDQFGIRALDWKVDEIERFTKGYKVIVFESTNHYQMQDQMKKVNDLYNGKNQIALMAIGGHGRRTEIELSDGDPLKTSHVRYVFRPYRHLFAKDAEVLLASCYNGKGHNKERNLANSLANTLPGVLINSCDRVLVGFDFELDKDGRYIKNSLTLKGGLLPTNCLYRVRASY